MKADEIRRILIQDVALQDDLALDNLKIIANGNTIIAAEHPFILFYALDVLTAVTGPLLTSYGKARNQFRAIIHNNVATSISSTVIAGTVQSDGEITGAVVGVNTGIISKH